MARATDILMEEHRGIERMLLAMERAIPTLQSGNAEPLPMFAQGVDFLTGFADRCHHYKEEKHMFPALSLKGPSAFTNPVDQLLDEHEQGRAYIRDMGVAVKRCEAGDKSALRDLADAAQRYTELLRAHIAKEDEVLTAAAQSLTPEEQDRLAETFERVEVEIMGVGTHERYHKMLDSLEA